MALGIASAGGSIGQFVMVPVGQHFLAAYGWSLSLTLIAVLALSMVALSLGISGKARPEAVEAALANKL